MLTKPHRVSLSRHLGCRWTPLMISTVGSTQSRGLTSLGATIQLRIGVWWVRWFVWQIDNRIWSILAWSGGHLNKDIDLIVLIGLIVLPFTIRNFSWMAKCSLSQMVLMASHQSIVIESDQIWNGSSPKPLAYTLSPSEKTLLLFESWPFFWWDCCRSTRWHKLGFKISSLVLLRLPCSNSAGVTPVVLCGVVR